MHARIAARRCPGELGGLRVSCTEITGATEFAPAERHDRRETDHRGFRSSLRRLR